MRVLVTGGTGFLGRAVVADLASMGCDVVAMARGGGPGISADVRDRIAVREAVLAVAPEVVVHLAALGNVRDSFLDPLTYFDVNAGGTLNLALALRELPATRVVFGSTQAVYGVHLSDLLTEDLVPSPESPYAASKLQAEQLLAAQARTGAIGAASLRFVNLAGVSAGVGDQDRNRLIPRVLEAAATGEPILVNGDGGTIRDYVHVADVAVAVRMAIDAANPGSYRAYNVSTGTGASVGDVIRIAEKVTGRKITVEHGPAGTEPRRLVADPTRIRSDLGWQPKRSSLVDILDDAWLAYR